MNNRICAKARKYHTTGVLSLSSLVAVFIFFLAVSTATCDEQKVDDECKEDSEYSWNPSNQNTSERLNRFYSLEELISSEYMKGNYAAATTHINEYLELAAVYKDNWNYGNAIHDSYRYLGLISYQEGDLGKAAEYLIKSSGSSGSPQLDTFGPEMDLANLLLKEGKTEEVIIYLKGIQKFWEMDDGIIDVWLKQIAQGEQPELSRFGTHGLNSIQQIIYLVTLLWPLAIILVVYFSKRSTLSRLKFILLSIPVAYLVMFTSSFVSFFFLSPILEVIPTSLVIYVLYVYTAIFQFVIPATVIFLLSKIKFFHAQPGYSTNTA